MDLVFLDIKNTVLKAIESLDGLPIEYLSIHTLNGKQTLLEAKKKAQELSGQKMVLLCLNVMKQGIKFATVRLF